MPSMVYDFQATTTERRRLEAQLRELETVNPISRRGNGRIRAICDMGVAEFCRFADIAYDSYYRLVHRSDTVEVRYRTITKIAHALNTIKGMEIYTPEWVVDNFRVLPATKQERMVSPSRKYRAAIRVMANSVKVIHKEHLKTAKERMKSTGLPYVRQRDLLAVAMHQATPASVTNMPANVSVSIPTPPVNVVHPAETTHKRLAKPFKPADPASRKNS